MITVKNITKITSYVLMAGLFSIAFSGCTKKPVAVDPAVNTLVVWGFEDEDAWKPTITNFNTNMPAVKVVYQKQKLDSDYEKRSLNSILSGQGPDVWAMPSDWVYRHKDQLYPMFASLQKTTDLDTQYVPCVKTSVMFDGKIYAMTPSAEPLMVYYNPKMLSDTINSLVTSTTDKDYITKITTLLTEPPKTWSDLSEAAKLLTKKNGQTITQSGLAMGSSRITNAQDILYLLMIQNGTKILSSDFKLATFNLPEDTSTGLKDTPGKRALEFYTSFSNPNSSNYTWNDSLGNDVDAFATGKAAMIFGYSGLEQTLLQKYPDFKYQKAFVPQNSQDTDKIFDYARFTAYGVSKISKNPAAGWTFVRSLMTTGDTLNAASKKYTSVKAPTYDLSLKNRTGANPEKLSLATAKSIVKGRYPEEFDGYIRNTISAVTSGTQNAQSALDLTANTLTDGMLRKEGW